jgi:hypothetical protein
MLKEQLSALFLISILFFSLTYLFGDIFYTALGLRLGTCYLFTELIYLWIFRIHKKYV